MASLWQDRSAPIPTDRFEPGRRFEIVVAGAGLTGLVTALLFARAGRSVAVIEAKQVGGGTTGRTTAKLSLLQGTHLSDMLSHTSLTTARAYIEGNREGIQWLLRYCDEHGVAVQRRDAYTFASTPDGAAIVEREFRAARRLGLDVSMQPADELPFASYGAVKLTDQAQFDPMAVLSALAADLRGRGGEIWEATMVTGARAGRPVVVRTTRGDVLADRLVLATGIPVLDRGLYFAKVVPQRSYAMAFSVPGRLPQGMYLSADSPKRSLRTAPGDHSDLLIVGGNGHVTGRTPSPERHFDDLQSWTERHFAGAEPVSRWSAQDYQPVGRVPYVGWLPRGRGRIFLATGYDKWGMGNSVAASLTLAADILGGHLPWARTLHRRITTPLDAATFVGANGAVLVWMAKGYLAAWRRQPPRSAVPDGSGMVTHEGVAPVGVCSIDGVERRVSAVCPHLGGVLSWNDAERSWDCPLHGSRFSADGGRLEGPAKHGLKRPAEPRRPGQG